MSLVANNEIGIGLYSNLPDIPYCSDSDSDSCNF